MSSETITSLSSTIVKTTEEAVKLVKTKEEIISQVILVKGNVKLLETAIKSIIGSQEQTENPLRLEGNLALLKYYLVKLQYLLHASICNFIKPQSGDIDKKTFATKNTIDINTNLKTWYRDNVIHTLADKLEEFSEKDSEDEKKTIVRAHCNIDKEFNLLTRKGVFPYDYIDSWERFTETCLPSKTNFYSQLYDQCITDQDYQHALDVWKTFNIKTLGEYSDLYLKNDVLLLADIFENFRRTCLLTYELDPLHFYTAPGLAFDAMLKTTGVQLELLTDIEKLMFIERGIRGGVSQCSNRYAKANNKYMKDEYDSNQESTYLMYFDINNLYGAAMSEYLPYGEFEFFEANEIGNLDIMNIPDNAEVGYIFDYISKTFLYEFHYDYILPKFQDKAKLLYTDTDSLIYQLNVPDIYEHINEDSHRFDTSDYEPNNPYGIEQKNKKVPGLMKDENNGQIMLEFVGLRAKMYAYKVHNDKIVKRSKGSTLASVKNISFDDYKRTLFDHEIIYKPQHLITSKKHCVFTIRQNKMILNPFDDKRVLNSKSTDTKPWGYERISEDADDLPNKRICIRDFIKRCIIQGYYDEETYKLLKSILEEVVIPDKAFEWLTEYDIIPSCQTIELLMDKKMELDQFVHGVLAMCEKEGYENIIIKKLNDIVVTLHPEIKISFKIYLFELLLKGKYYPYVENTVLPLKNISNNYKTINKTIDNAMGKAAYYVRSGTLSKLYTLQESKKLQWKFQPLTDTQHANVLKWIQDNVKKGEGNINARPGWSCGPDSSPWPSEHLQDYIRTLCILNEIRE
ncbi:hypothetical protein NQ315_012445 [Exocentrus adspersus]|uniref:DNA-directed DNA polymerase n=1 Tax=Exocentrus adspersus TaxID=1586481 RepID=A0AAV8VNN3_9CUCU|nr:hypothetical protein NQ315_012445 [Exocentrus adspersus]